MRHDIRLAVRLLAKNPGFSLTVFAVLTLGIGLNATVFTLLKSLALSPLAGIDGSASLAVVLNETKAGRQTSLSYPDYEYVRDHATSFASGSSTSTCPAASCAGRDVVSPSKTNPLKCCRSWSSDPENSSRGMSYSVGSGPAIPLSCSTTT